MKNKLYGAILGDAAGLPYEGMLQDLPNLEDIQLHFKPTRISDDSILTLASARSIIHNTNIEHEYKYWANKYPNSGYGAGFRVWRNTPPGTIGNSYGNGVLMRLSPFIWSASGRISKSLTSHSHKDSKLAVGKLIDLYAGNGNKTALEPQPFKIFTAKALDTVHFVESVFFNTSSTHEAIKVAVSCGGDTDTTASIVAELSNFHRNDLTKEDKDYVESLLDPFQLYVLKTFNK